MVLTGAYKYLQIEFTKEGLISPYICITVLTSLADTKNTWVVRKASHFYESAILDGSTDLQNFKMVWT